MTRKPNLQIQILNQNLPPSLQTAKAKVATFCAARSEIITPLLWLTSALLFKSCGGQEMAAIGQLAGTW
jgi:hypothetical protein